MIVLDQKQQKVKTERETLIEVHLLFIKVQNSQPAHNVLRTSPNPPILVETLRTIIGPK